MTNWTGAPPLQNNRLLGLLLVWLVGRLAMWLSGYLPAGLVVEDMRTDPYSLTEEGSVW